MTDTTDSNPIDMNNSSQLMTYLQFFRGRENCFAQQGESYYYPVQHTLDEYYVHRHLNGDLTIGLYLLNTESLCHLICIDIDIPKGELDHIDFSNPANKYSHLKDQLLSVVSVLQKEFNLPEDAILLEDTGGRGYHVWIFFKESISGSLAVKFGREIKSHIEFEIEFFPKQSCLTATRKYGNLIKLPLGIHRKYGSRSSFFTLSEEGIKQIDDLEDNLAHLSNVSPLSSELVENLVSSFSLDDYPNDEPLNTFYSPVTYRPQYEGSPDTLLNKCSVIKNLYAKAESGNRFSHTEAFYFADIMLSVTKGEKFIHKTLSSSLADDYDQERTQNEIERIRPLHPPSCLNLVQNKICPDYCKESVRKNSEDPLTQWMTPCSVWLEKSSTYSLPNQSSLVERIGTPDNVKRAFFQLKQYHEHEDALFYDPFDFELFSSQLDSNCRVIAQTLNVRKETSLLGFMSVALPKKVDESLELKYRYMSYASVYDLIPIQAIFNEIAPYIENTFQNCSYGYRWNLDYSSQYRIFEDWREVYPIFRNDIMSALEQYPRGYYVCCDIKGYYDNINHDILIEQLRKLKFRVSG